MRLTLQCGVSHTYTSHTRSTSAYLPSEMALKEHSEPPRCNLSLTHTQVHKDKVAKGDKSIQEKLDEITRTINNLKSRRDQAVKSEVILELLKAVTAIALTPRRNKPLGSRHISVLPTNWCGSFRHLVELPWRTLQQEGKVLLPVFLLDGSQVHAVGRWFPLGTPVFSTSKTDISS